MHSYLEAWLAAILPILQRELSSQIKLSRAETMPASAKTMNLGVSIGDNRFTVSAELSEFPSLLGEAGVPEAESNTERDYELWRRVIQDAAAVLAEISGGAKVELVEGAPWSSAGASAAYEFRLGEARMLVAFTDSGQAPGPAGGKQAAVGDANPSKAAPPGLDLLLDVELETSLRFGSAEMSLNEVLELGPGDVVELDRHIVDPVDLLVGDKVVARGEVVLVNGAFGLRVTEVAEPRKCLESVRCLF